MTTRILIADDQALVRAGLRMILEIEPDLEVVAEAGDGLTAARRAVSDAIDVALLDIRMPGIDGIEATRRITADPASGGVGVLILTTYEVDEYVFEALRAGAAGFLLKSTSPERLAEAIRAVAAGEGLIAPEVTRRLIAEFARSTPSRVAPPAELSLLTPGNWT